MNALKDIHLELYHDQRVLEFKVFQRKKLKYKGLWYAVIVSQAGKQVGYQLGLDQASEIFNKTVFILKSQKKKLKCNFQMQTFNVKRVKSMKDLNHKLQWKQPTQMYMKQTRKPDLA